MSANSVKIVELKNGRIGIARNSQPTRLPKNKVAVELIDASHNPIIENGKKITVLCNPDNLKLIGFSD